MKIKEGALVTFRREKKASGVLYLPDLPIEPLPEGESE